MSVVCNVAETLRGQAQIDPASHELGVCVLANDAHYVFCWCNGCFSSTKSIYRSR